MIRKAILFVGVLMLATFVGHAQGPASSPSSASAHSRPVRRAPPQVVEPVVAGAAARPPRLRSSTRIRASPSGSTRPTRGPSSSLESSKVGRRTR